MPWPPSAGTRCSCLAGRRHRYYGETWVYDLSANTWTNKAPAAAPSARYGHAMAYLGGDQVLLFGGFDAGGLNGETWVYDLSANTWTNQAPAAAPSARDSACHGLPRRGPGAPVWRVRWLPMTARPGSMTSAPTPGRTRPPPPARPHETGHAMASLGGDQVLLFGGYDAGGRGETWVYDLSDQHLDEPGPRRRPVPANCHAMASLGGDPGAPVWRGRSAADQRSRDPLGLMTLSGTDTWTQLAPT